MLCYTAAMNKHVCKTRDVPLQDNHEEGKKKKGEGGSTHIITDSLLERLLSLHLDAAQGARRQCRHSETLLCCLFRYESAHTARGNGSPVSFSGSRVSPDVATRTTYVHIGSFFKCH